jgi:hypothetical protein
MTFDWDGFWRLREEHWETDAAFALELGVDTSTVSKWRARAAVPRRGTLTAKLKKRRPDLATAILRLYEVPRPVKPAAEQAGAAAALEQLDLDLIADRLWSIRATKVQVSRILERYTGSFCWNVQCYALHAFADLHEELLGLAVTIEERREALADLKFENRAVGMRSHLLRRRVEAEIAYHQARIEERLRDLPTDCARCIEEVEVAAAGLDSVAYRPWMLTAKDIIENWNVHYLADKITVGRAEFDWLEPALDESQSVDYHHLLSKQERSFLRFDLKFLLGEMGHPAGTLPDELPCMF